MEWFTPHQVLQRNEEKEKNRKTDRVQKAVKLEKHWNMLRECVGFIVENSDAWVRRTEEESRMIEKEEKETRLEMQRHKKQKYGKAGQKKL